MGWCLGGGQVTWGCAGMGRIYIQPPCIATDGGFLTTLRPLLGRTNEASASPHAG